MRNIGPRFGYSAAQSLLVERAQSSEMLVSHLHLVAFELC